ncbi:MAG: hypothetical protein EON48_16065, partial [Acetobacteraceae bacterium]
MKRTANRVDRKTARASAAVVRRASPSHDFARTVHVPRTLIRPQSGLAVQWRQGQAVAPAATPSRALSLTVKRGIDIVAAIAGLLLLSPLFLVVACCIWRADRGPVLFRQGRVGRDGRVFALLKFRSMYADRCDATGIAQATANDNRVTRIGAFLRRTSVDELPQLINVLCGDMSLVGPRPHVPGMQAAGMDYEELMPHYIFRQSMRPGLTGWAQCHGLRGPTTDQIKALRRI